MERRRREITKLLRRHAGNLGCARLRKGLDISRKPRRADREIGEPTPGRLDRVGRDLRRGRRLALEDETEQLLVRPTAQRIVGHYCVPWIFFTRSGRRRMSASTAAS